MIKPQSFNSASRFSDGMARVQMGGPMGKGGQLGLIDRTGKVVIKPQYQFAEDFSEGLCAVVIGGKYGYINKTGGGDTAEFSNRVSFRGWVSGRLGG